MLADEEGIVNIPVWGNAIHDIIEDTTYSIKILRVDDYFGIRLATTSCTTFDAIKPISIDWQQYNKTSNTSRLCCPIILSVKVEKFLQCINVACRRKVVPFPGESKVSCDYPTCRRKMLVKRCPSNIIIEVTLAQKEDECKQHTVTVFTKVIQNVVDITNKNEQEIEDMILELENIDFIMNRKKIFTFITNNNDAKGNEP